MPTYRDSVAAHSRRPAEEGPQARSARAARPSCPPNSKGRCSRLYGHYEQAFRAVGGERRGAGAWTHAAGVHRRVQQHQRLEAGVRLRRRLGAGRCRTAATVVVPGALPLFSNEIDGRWSATPQHASSSIRRSSNRARHERRVQADCRARRSRSSRPTTAQRFPGRERRRPDRRRPAARGDEHRRQGRQARRTRPLRRLGVDAHRRLGRQHRHAHPRRPRLRHAAAVRAGRRARPAAHELCRRTTTGTSMPEYAEVYGVPFSFIPTAGDATPPTPGPTADACPGARRAHRLRNHLPAPAGLPLRAADVSACTPSSRRTRTTRFLPPTLPTVTENAPIVGERSVLHAGRTPRAARERGGVPAGEAHVREVLPPGRRGTRRSAGRAPVRRRCAGVAVPAAARHREALAGRVRHLQGQHLSAAAAARRVRARRRRPHLQGHRRQLGRDAGAEAAAARRTTRSARRRYVDFDTTKPVYATDPTKCHVSHVVADTESWEQKMAQVLEDDARGGRLREEPGARTSPSPTR